MSDDRHPSEFVGWPEAIGVLGHAVALRALRDNELVVYQRNGRRLVKRSTVDKLRRHRRPLARPRGDDLMLPTATQRPRRL